MEELPVLSRGWLGCSKGVKPRLPCTAHRSSKGWPEGWRECRGEGSATAHKEQAECVSSAESESESVSSAELRRLQLFMEKQLPAPMLQAAWLHLFALPPMRIVHAYFHNRSTFFCQHCLFLASHQKQDLTALCMLHPNASNTL